MKTTESYVFSYLLVTVLALISMIVSANIYVSMLMYGAIITAVTVRSFTDGGSKPLTAFMTILFAVFSAASGGAYAFVIFYECRINKPLKLILPPAAYAVYAAAAQKRTLPHALLDTFIIFAAVLGIFAVEELINGYAEIKRKVAGTVSSTAIGEMYTKQLNRELVIKNYLTDRNARLEERENISRSIHNSVGHSITAAIMTLEAADMLFEASPERAREKMNTANERIRSSLDSIRHAVRVLDDEAGCVALSDLISDINTASENFMMDTMRRVHIDVQKPSEELYIPHEHTEFLTGAVQELLSNGVRHGSADTFFIHITADSGHIKLVVRDNGKSSFSAKNSAERISSGFGLKKLISYAERCGGNAGFANENGFSSEIILPIEGGQYGTDQSNARR